MPRIFPVPHAIQVSLDGVVWYKLTDHNRSEINVNPEPIEKSDRMASGMMRKWGVAVKNTISTSWSIVPSRTDETVDGGYSSEWLDAFCKANRFVPMWVRVYAAAEESPETGFYPNELTRQSSNLSYTDYNVFITKYSSSVTKRTTHMDLTTMEIEFTEI